jgi:hypothetical protein
MMMMALTSSPNRLQDYEAVSRLIGGLSSVQVGEITHPVFTIHFSTIDLSKFSASAAPIENYTAAQ